MVEFAINSSINTTVGYAPFELNHRYMPRSGQHISTDTTFKGVRVPIFPIVVCVCSAYVIGTGVGFRVESGAVALLQLDL